MRLGIVGDGGKHTLDLIFGFDFLGTSDTGNASGAHCGNERSWCSLHHEGIIGRLKTLMLEKIEADRQVQAVLISRHVRYY